MFIITPEYPPHSGGVSDYTHLVALGLTEAGDEVHVWGPSGSRGCGKISGLFVVDELGGFGPSDLRRTGRSLNRFVRPRRLVVQWVPHGYGFRSVNVPFCLWLWTRAMFRGDEIDIVVHEPCLAFDEGSVAAEVGRRSSSFHDGDSSSGRTSGLDHHSGLGVSMAPLGVRAQGSISMAAGAQQYSRKFGSRICDTSTASLCDGNWFSPGALRDPWSPGDQTPRKDPAPASRPALRSDSVIDRER